MSNRRLYIQLDGPVLHAKSEMLKLQPEALYYLRQLVREAGFEIIFFERAQVSDTARESFLLLLDSERIPYSHTPRMPEATQLHEGTAHTFMVTDTSDAFAAPQKPATIIPYESGQAFEADGITPWARVFRQLVLPDRVAVVERKTSETAIYVSVNLDQPASATIETGIGFFDHMLEQIARHGDFALELQCKGDLHVDEHHTIEDVALALGQALHEALGDKRGLQRYGFTLPMDEARAEIALDFSGRNWLVWEADFQREMVGKMPTEMFKHFFKSLTDTAKMTLHVKAVGENEHHKIEAIFKGFGRALRMALQREVNNEIPSTKGSL